ncbi:unnamed protein product [Acanthoscelides obtectus]|uniref:Uncharacterized protein n=1 Tax=Acanthoscelides obtectus TaxID=200917 RepID=A0A9P0M5X1_ACAOB|nr:unnamed protein product [Acanthoscelides obtectus]CAK1644953.1 Aminoacylase-1A [Acanthoscelides obtectus]
MQEDKWTYKPFSAHMDEQGNIYARGAQDMKSVGIQYLEAIRWLMSKGVTLRRTLHVTFVPDEEIGGKDGMAVFVKTNLFKNLNVCFALDEGMASETDVFALYYGERSIWRKSTTSNMFLHDADLFSLSITIVQYHLLESGKRKLGFYLKYLITLFSELL